MFIEDVVFIQFSAVLCVLGAKENCPGMHTVLSLNIQLREHIAGCIMSEDVQPTFSPK